VKSLAAQVLAHTLGVTARGVAASAATISSARVWFRQATKAEPPARAVAARRRRAGTSIV
jgi:hypothetical protein